MYLLLIFFFFFFFSFFTFVFYTIEKGFWRQTSSVTVTHQELTNFGDIRDEWARLHSRVDLVTKVVHPKVTGRGVNLVGIGLTREGRSHRLTENW